MKRLGTLLLAVLLVGAIALPACAMETQFGGYFRARTFMAQNFTGEDETEARDVQAADLRTRLYFTAILHENLKFVNKFEFDTTWGSNKDKGSGNGSGAGGWGDIGADGTNVEIKNSYVDFNPFSMLNIKIGAQGGTLFRGFVFDDDFTGAVVTFKGDNFAIPIIYAKGYEGGMGRDRNDFDADYYAIAPSFKAGGLRITPQFLYVTSDNLSEWGPLGLVEETGIYYAGVDLDFAQDNMAFWFSGIYQGGDFDVLGTDKSIDFAAYLAAAGFNLGLAENKVDIHGQFIYASGQDPEEDTDDEINAFTPPPGRSYYWAEIMGYGKLGDATTWSNAYADGKMPNDSISNIMVAGLGVSFSPMKELKFTVDGWWAALAEETVTTVKGERTDELGVEVDLCITYQIVPNLTLDVVGAYLFAGDAITRDVENDANPYEVGTRLTLSF